MKINTYSFSGKSNSNLDDILILSDSESSLIIVMDPFVEDFDINIHSELKGFLNSSQKESVSIDSALQCLNEYSGIVKYSIAVVYLKKRLMRYAYVGDCRIYVNDNLVTIDHSQAWQSIKREYNHNIIGGLCIDHPRQHLLYKRLPTSELFSIKEIHLESDYKIIIATDGFWTKHHYDIILNKALNITSKNYEDNASVVILNS